MESKEKVINEYLEVSVKHSLVQPCRECYTALGWTINRISSGIGKVTLKMERSKKIKNRIELCNLQHVCEDAFNAIEKLENSSSKKTMLAYLLIKIAGIILLTGSILAYQKALILVFIILFIIGLIGCILPLPLIKEFINEKSREKSESNKYLNIIHEACKKASLLLK